MNLFTEPVQLVLSLLFIALLDASFIFLYACTHDMVFNACFLYSNLSIHVCLSLHATWHSPYHSLESSDSPRSHVQVSKLGACGFSRFTDQRGAAEAWIIGRPSEAPSF